MKPVFIFSLPRSGSTLLQRMLTSLPQVASTAEPWFLLPYIYSLKTEGQYSKYWQNQLIEAVSDFCDCLPEGRETYNQEIRRFAERLYEKAAHSNAIYFVDKTPRYHLIIDELIEIFPDAKFIFLWRNPLAVASSINTTWGGGKWKLYAYKVDLYQGLDNLVSAYNKYQKFSYSIQYEDLVTNPSATWPQLLAYLNLPYNENALKLFADVSFKGKMGDPTGIHEYNALSRSSLDKWLVSFSNPLRKVWARSYLKWLGKQRLEVMGYNYEELLAQLSDVQVSTRFILSDIIRLVYGVVYCLCEPRIIVEKLSSIKNWRNVVSHR